jgi:histidine ammonia-lyase
MSLIVTPGDVTLTQLRQLYAGQEGLQLNPSCHARIEASARVSGRGRTW